MTKEVNKKELKSAARVLRAILHPLRMRILEFIMDHQPVHVSKIYKTLKIEQSVASSHLRILREARFVQVRRDGQRKLYSIDPDRFEQVLDGIREYFKK